MTSILITSAGGVNGVNVVKALRRQRELKLRIIATDAQPLAATFFMSDGYHVVPRADDRRFIPAILRIAKREKVRILLPMYSEEILELAKHREKIERAGIKMAIASHEIVRRTWDKQETGQLLERLGIPHPKTYTEQELDRKRAPLPLFVKTLTGSGTRDAHPLRTWEEVSYHRKRLKKYVIQDYLSGEEYTIDALGDLEGKMVAASPRIRFEVKGGLATKSVTVQNVELVRYAKTIIERLGLTGPVNIQCKMKRGRPYFFDVNPRFPSGGLPLDVAAGFNIPLLVIKMLLGKPLGAIRIRTGLTMLRYWDALFVEKKKGSYRFHDFYHEFT